MKYVYFLFYFSSRNPLLSNCVYLVFNHGSACKMATEKHGMAENEGLY